MTFALLARTTLCTALCHLLSLFLTLNDLVQLAIVLQRILFDLPDSIPKVLKSMVGSAP
jgi:hypothetical protein